MTRNENVSEYYDRLTLLKSGAQAALEDKYDNADLLLAPLNDCAFFMGPYQVTDLCQQAR